MFCFWNIYLKGENILMKIITIDLINQTIMSFQFVFNVAAKKVIIPILIKCSINELKGHLHLLFHLIYCLLVL